MVLSNDRMFLYVDLSTLATYESQYFDLLEADCHSLDLAYAESCLAG